MLRPLPTEEGNSIIKTGDIVLTASEILIPPGAIIVTTPGFWRQLTEGVWVFSGTCVHILPVDSIPRKVARILQMSAARNAPVEPNDHPKVRDVVHEG